MSYQSLLKVQKESVAALSEQRLTDLF